MTIGSEIVAELQHAEDLPPVHQLIDQLDLENKVRLLTGATAWRLHAIDEIGLRSVVVSDGPVGVRGTGEIPGATSLLFPSPSAVAATWDVDAAAALGRLFALEARRHGVDVVLAPQVNIQRTPVAGRHFECYSEDPLLTGSMAAALVGALQAGGVAAAPKHFVANDSETARTSYVARVGEQALREVYLAPFERAVAAGAWCVMSAYSGVDDGVESAPMTEHRHLVDDVLRREWGFDGVVVSDWLAARRTEEALAGLDLVMPGPGGPWEDHLVAAVRDGSVPEAVIDDKVARILCLAERVGALGPTAYPPTRHDDHDDHDHYDHHLEPGHHRRDRAGDRELLRDLAARSVVVIRRDITFPIASSGLRRLALLGPNAVSAYVLGGGSSSVTPAHVVSPLEGLRAALPGVEIDLHRGGTPGSTPPRWTSPRAATTRATVDRACGSATSTRRGPSCTARPSPNGTGGRRICRDRWRPWCSTRSSSRPRPESTASRSGRSAVTTSSWTASWSRVASAPSGPR